MGGQDVRPRPVQGHRHEGRGEDLQERLLRLPAHRPTGRHHPGQRLVAARGEVEFSTSPVRNGSSTMLTWINWDELEKVSGEWGPELASAGLAPKFDDGSFDMVEAE